MRKSTMGGIIALLSAGLITITAGIGSAVNGKWFKNPNVGTWFNSWGQNKQVELEDKNDGDTSGKGGGLVDVTGDNGIALTMVEILSEEFAVYDISPQADTAYHITATVNADAADKSVIGGIGWKNKTSEWANGKEVSEYATLTQLTTNGLEFTLEVKKAFGEPIEVKVASCMDSNVNATAEVNYLKELSGFTAVLNPSLNSACTARLYVGDTANTIQIIPTYKTGTIEGTFSACSTTFTFHEVSKSSINTALKNVSGNGSTGCVTSFTRKGFDFTVPMAVMQSRGGDSTFCQNADTVLNNYIYKNGYTDSLTAVSAGYSCAIQNISCTVTYTYGGDYSQTMTKDCGSTYINKKGLNEIATINNISLSETNIVVYPK